MPAKKIYRKRRPAKKPMKKRAKRTNVPDKASLSETRSLIAPGGNTINTLYSLMNTSLEQYTRAPLVAQGYQHYRIKHISLKIKSPFDTWISSGNTYAKPYLYYMIDKSGSLPSNITLSALKSMGCQPKRLDDKTIKISWRPSVLTLTSDGSPVLSANNSQYKISPWLSTNKNSLASGAFVCSDLNHLGIFWYAETPAGPSTILFNVEAVLDIEFKKPLNSSLTGESDAIKA